MQHNRRTPDRYYQLTHSHVAKFLHHMVATRAILEKPVLVTASDWRYYPDMRVYTQGGPTALFASNVRNPRGRIWLPAWNRTLRPLLTELNDRIGVAIQHARDPERAQALIGRMSHIDLWKAGARVYPVRVPDPEEVERIVSGRAALIQFVHRDADTAALAHKITRGL